MKFKFTASFTTNISKVRLNFCYNLLLLTYFCVLNSFDLSEASSLDTIRLSIDENSPADVLIGTLSSQYADFDESISKDNDFYFTKTSYDEVEIRNTRTLDREKCPPEFFNDNQCIYKIPLIYGKNYGNYKTIEITINDQDDNEPKFDKPRIEFSFPENTVVGSAQPLDQAFDLDSPENGILDYELREVNTEDLDSLGKFELDKWIRQGDEAIMPRLVLKEALDFELTQNYSLELVAIGAKHQSVLPITILVQDINDNAPEFGQSFIQVLIPEDTKVGDIVSIIVANDIDSGENGRVQFMFSGESIQESTGYFEIDKESGEIRLIESLVNKGGTKHSISIIARDCGEKPLQDVMTWNFEIEDINDFTPQIKFRPMGACYENNSTYYIPENYGYEEDGGRNKVLGIFTVEDEDKGLFGQTRLYLLENEEYFELMETKNSKTYLFKQKFSFDHEEGPNSFELSLLAHDCATSNDVMTSSMPNCSRLETRKSFKFEIADENDNWPRFEQHGYEDYYTEEIPTKDLRQVKAVDLDSGLNGEIIYSINSKSKASNYFQIDPKTGWIKTVVPLDLEVLGSNIEVSIMANDKGTPSRHSVTTYLVHLSDINDNPPRFDTKNSQYYELQLLENQPPGSWVGNIKAMDPDSDRAPIEFSYRTLYPGEQTYFKIDRNSGRVISIKQFDFETVKSEFPEYREQGCFRFFAIATEKTNSPPIGHEGSSEIEVKVVIQDVNDNPPEIVLEKTENNVVIPWDAYKGYSITKIFATDRDNSSVLNYEIAENSVGHRFAIDFESGEVYAKHDLGLLTETLERDQDYPITVHVSDGVHKIPVQVHIRLSANWTLFNHSMVAREDRSPGFSGIITQVPRVAIYMTALIVLIVLVLIIVWAFLIMKFRGSSHRRMRREKKGKQIAMDITLPYHHSHNHMQMEHTKRMSDTSSGLFQHPTCKQGVMGLTSKYGNGHLQVQDNESPTDSQLMSSHTIPLRSTFTDSSSDGYGQHHHHPSHHQQQVQFHTLGGGGVGTGVGSGSVSALQAQMSPVSGVYSFQMAPSSENSLTLTKGRKGSRNAPPVVEYGDRREPDFWLPRSLDSQTASNSSRYPELSDSLSTSGNFLRIQRPGNICSPNRVSVANKDLDPRNSPVVAPRNPRNENPDASRNDGGSPTSSCGILINPSNQILQPPASGHEKWNLPRDNSFRLAQGATQAASSGPRTRNSVDLDTIDEDFQTMNASLNNNPPLPDLCQDAHHSSLEKQQQQHQQQQTYRHSSLPSTAGTAYLGGPGSDPSSGGQTVTSVSRTAIV